MTGAASLRRRLPVAFAVCAACAALVWNAAVAVSDRPITVVEGAHLLAAQGVAQGRLPCRDVACGAAPLYPLALAPLLGGATALGQRLLNAALAGFGLLVLGAALAQRTRRGEVGAVAAFSLAASPHWVGAVVAGGASGAAALAICAATAAALSTFRPVPRAAAYAAAAGLAIGCAPLVAVAVLPLAACVSADAGDARRRVLLAIAATAVALVAGLWPVALWAPPGALADAWSALRAGAAARSAHGIAVSILAVSPGAALALLAGLAAAPALVTGRRWAALGGLVAAALGVAAALVVPGEEIPTAALVAPIAAAAGLAAAWALVEGAGSPLRHVLWLAPAMALYVPIPSADLGRADAEVAAIAAFVERRVPKGRILTPLPAIAAAAGRRVVRGTELGAHAVLGKEGEAEAERLHLTTLRALARVAETRRPVAIALHRSDDALDFGRDRRTGARLPAAAVRRFQRAVAERYERAFTTRSWAVYVRRAEVDAKRE